MFKSIFVGHNKIWGAQKFEGELLPNVSTITKPRFPTNQQQLFPSSSYTRKNEIVFRKSYIFSKSNTIFPQKMVEVGIPKAPKMRKFHQ